LVIRDIIARIVPRRLRRRGREVDLLTGIETASSRPVWRIVLIGPQLLVSLRVRA
jgi:hypothetical protein